MKFSISESETDFAAKRPSGHRISGGQLVTAVGEIACVQLEAEAHSVLYSEILSYAEIQGVVV